MKTKRTALIVLSILALTALACSLTGILGGSPEPGTAAGTAEPVQPGEGLEGEEPDATEAPRRLELPPTPTAFHVTSEDDPRGILDLSQPDYFDYFEDPDSWRQYESEGFAAYRMEDGQLVGLDEEPEERYVYWSYTFMQAGNTYAEVSATNGDCVGADSMGFVIRVDPNVTPSGYAFEVSCEGAWRFRRFRGSDSPTEIVDWTASDAINTGLGAVNRLGIYAYQTDFSFFVNGYPVGEAQDLNLSYTLGYIALYVRASRTFDLTGSFDDLAFWNIPFQQ